MPTVYRPGATIDRYKIVRSLGQGAASRSYLAQDIISQQDVVLKFPLDDLIGGAAIFARYVRERKIGQLLTHPSIQRHVNQDEQRQAEYLAPVAPYARPCASRHWRKKRLSLSCAPCVTR